MNGHDGVGARRRPVIAILHLGRSKAKGEAVRVRSWIQLIEAAGGDPIPIRLLSEHRPIVRIDASVLASVLRGCAVPEAAMWSRSSVLARLDQLRPQAVICVTSRAFRPEIAGGQWSTVLDHVDLLSASYAERSQIALSLPRRMTYALLHHTARRFEIRSPRWSVTQVAAGWSDARALGAEWVPITIPPTDLVRSEPTGPDVSDVCFVGTLSYPPNVEALAVLGAAWPDIRRSVPNATAVVAGANPVSRVVEIAREYSWRLLPNFSDVGQVYARAKLAVSPLLTASGIQIKVLEAAAYGVPQVVLPAAVAGFEPGFPVRVAGDPSRLADEIVSALQNPGAGAAQALRAASVVRERYGAVAWAPVVQHLLRLHAVDVPREQ